MQYDRDMEYVARYYDRERQQALERRREEEENTSSSGKNQTKKGKTCVKMCENKRNCKINFFQKRKTTSFKCGGKIDGKIQSIASGKIEGDFEELDKAEKPRGGGQRSLRGREDTEQDARA